MNQGILNDVWFRCFATLGERTMDFTLGNTTNVFFIAGDGVAVAS